MTVLADTAIRGQDLDEARAMEAKRKAEEHISSSHGDVDYEMCIRDSGQASRISGVTPAAISILLVWLKKQGMLRRSA